MNHIQSADDLQSIAIKNFQPEFHGQGSEYFKIWIINLVLSILTLGIYSAWATIRLAIYKTEHVSLNFPSLDEFKGETKVLLSAVGDEIAQGFDIEFVYKLKLTIINAYVYFS